MPAMPPVPAATAPALDVFRNARRVTRAILLPPWISDLWRKCKCCERAGQAHGGPQSLRIELPARGLPSHCNAATSTSRTSRLRVMLMADVSPRSAGLSEAEAQLRLRTEG